MNRPYAYILDGTTPVPSRDVEEWCSWMGTNNDKREVKKEHIGDVLVSTVFTGIDLNWYRDGLPVLFETMAFSHDKSPWNRQIFGRYSSWDDAVEGHKCAVQEISSYLRFHLPDSINQSEESSEKDEDDE